MQYRRLDPDKILSTARKLEKRIGERFPDSGLHRVAGELMSLAADTAQEAARLNRPNEKPAGGVSSASQQN